MIPIKTNLYAVVPMSMHIKLNHFFVMITDRFMMSQIIFRVRILVIHGMNDIGLQLRKYGEVPRFKVLLNFDTRLDY